MKFQKCGQLYKFNSDNIITNKIETIEIVEETKSIVDFIISSTIDIFDCEPNSAYLRGSCIDRKIENNTTIDIDVVFVFDDKTFYNKVYNLGEKISFGRFPYVENKMFMTDTQKEIEKNILEKFKKNVEIDVELSCEEFFQQDYQKRFLSKQVYGTGKNLSLSKLSRETFYQSLKSDILPNRRKYCLQKLYKLKNLFYLKANFLDGTEIRILKSIIKLFYRQYSLDLHLNENCFSKDVYYCHNILIKNYPQLSSHIEKVLDLFLNVDNYSHNDIRLILTELEYVINEIEFLSDNYKEIEFFV